MRSLALALLALSAPLLADTVTRGPYLQLGTPHSMTVRWRTDVPEAGRLWIGSSTATLSLVGTETASTREHALKALGLAPGTVYYYAVGGGGGRIRAGGTAEYSFSTPPLPGAALPTRIWALGDAGVSAVGSARNKADQAAVRDAYLSFAKGRRPDLWLMLGDDAYDSGTDEQYGRGVFDVYAEILRSSVLWPSPGNHDYGSTGGNYGPMASAAAYYAVFTLPTRGEAGGAPSGTEAYYSFDHANAHFISLDSHYSVAYASAAMLSWLAADLAATTQTWKVAYWHHPPYSKGSHDSDSETDSCTARGEGCRMTLMREKVLPILEGAGVDLVLTGHSHDYERSFLLNGHYGPSSTLEDRMGLDRGTGAPSAPYVKDASNKGTVYVVCGTGGWLGDDLDAPGKMNHPAMAVSLAELGSLVVDVDGPRMDVTFLGVHGPLDRFSILKEPDQTLNRK